MTAYPALFEDSNLSGLPGSNPGSGKPWLHGSGVIVVGVDGLSSALQEKLNASGGTVSGTLTLDGALVSTKSASQLGYHSIFTGAIGSGEIGLYVLPSSTGSGASALYVNLGTVAGNAYGTSVIGSVSGGIINQLRNTGGPATNIVWGSSGNDAFTYYLSGSQELSLGLDSSVGALVVSQAGNLDSPRFSISATTGNVVAYGAITSGVAGASNGSVSARATNSNAYATMYGSGQDAFLKVNSAGAGNYRGLRFGYGVSTEDWLFGYFGGLDAGNLAIYGPFGAHEYKADGAVNFGGSVSCSGVAKLGTFTASTLPIASANSGASAVVVDSSLAFTAANVGTSVSGGGSHKTPVFSNGTNWVIG